MQIKNRPIYNIEFKKNPKTENYRNKSDVSKVLMSRARSEHAYFFSISGVMNERKKLEEIYNYDTEWARKAIARDLFDRQTRANLNISILESKLFWPNKNRPIKRIALRKSV